MSASASPQLSDGLIAALAKDLNLEPALVRAVCEVESGGSGFYPAGAKTPSGSPVAGLPVILFEPAVFWRRLGLQRPPLDPVKILQDPARGQTSPAFNIPIEHVLHRKWGELPYGSSLLQYDKLARASAVCRPAALESASWGAWQIMGYHWKALGFPSAEEFTGSMGTLEGQARAFALYIMVNGLAPKLRGKDWAGFAKAYNGPGYARNRYDTKLAKAYQAALKG